MGLSFHVYKVVKFRKLRRRGEIVLKASSDNIGEDDGDDVGDGDGQGSPRLAALPCHHVCCRGSRSINQVMITMIKKMMMMIMIMLIMLLCPASICCLPSLLGPQLSLSINQSCLLQS